MHTGWKGGRSSGFHRFGVNRQPEEPATNGPPLRRRAGSLPKNAEIAGGAFLPGSKWPSSTLRCIAARRLLFGEEPPSSSCPETKIRHKSRAAMALTDATARRHRGFWPMPDWPFPRSPAGRRRRTSALGRCGTFPARLSLIVGRLHVLLCDVTNRLGGQGVATQGRYLASGGAEVIGHRDWKSSMRTLRRYSTNPVLGLVRDAEA